MGHQATVAGSNFADCTAGQNRLCERTGASRRPALDRSDDGVQAKITAAPTKISTRSIKTAVKILLCDLLFMFISSSP